MLFGQPCLNRLLPKLPAFPLSLTTSCVRFAVRNLNEQHEKSCKSTKGLHRDKGCLQVTLSEHADALPWFAAQK